MCLLFHPGSFLTADSYNKWIRYIKTENKYSTKSHTEYFTARNSRRKSVTCFRIFERRLCHFSSPGRACSSCTQRICCSRNGSVSLPLCLSLSLSFAPSPAILTSCRYQNKGNKSLTKCNLCMLNKQYKYKDILVKV